MLYLSFDKMSREIIIKNYSNHFNTAKLVNQIKKELY